MKHILLDPKQPSATVSLNLAKDWHLLADADRDAVVQLAQNLVDVVLSAVEAERVKQIVSGQRNATMASVLAAVDAVLRARPAASHGAAD